MNFTAVEKINVGEKWLIEKNSNEEEWPLEKLQKMISLNKRENNLNWNQIARHPLFDELEIENEEDDYLSEFPFLVRKMPHLLSTTKIQTLLQFLKGEIFNPIFLDLDFKKNLWKLIFYASLREIRIGILQNFNFDLFAQEIGIYYATENFQADTAVMAGYSILWERRLWSKKDFKKSFNKFYSHKQVGKRRLETLIKLIEIVF